MDQDETIENVTDQLDDDDWDVDMPRRNPVDYILDEPAKVLGWLGTAIFILGWAAIIYLVVDLQSDFPDGESFRYRLSVAVGHGTNVTLAAAALWFVSAYIARGQPRGGHSATETVDSLT